MFENFVSLFLMRKMQGANCSVESHRKERSRMGHFLDLIHLVEVAVGEASVHHGSIFLSWHQEAIAA